MTKQPSNSGLKLAIFLVAALIVFFLSATLRPIALFGGKQEITEKTSTKVNSQVSIKGIGRHLLDFYK
jgi:hypothetical protein